jgi:hypothetical protein
VGHDKIRPRWGVLFLVAEEFLGKFVDCHARGETFPTPPDY